MLVVGWMRDNADPYWIGIAIEHGFEHLKFIFYFGCSRAVVCDFSLPIVSLVVAHAKSGMGVSHPISQEPCRPFEPPIPVEMREEAAHFMGVVSHQAVPMDLNVLSEAFGIGIE